MTSKRLPTYSAIDPCDYLSLAKELSRRTEATCHRTAADRAYYAAFLTSRDELERKGYATPYGSTEDHQYIPRVLKRRDVLGAFGNEEDRMRRSRNCVAYDTADTHSTDAKPVDWMIRTAEEIIQRVQALQAQG